MTRRSSNRPGSLARLVVNAHGGPAFEEAVEAAVAELRAGRAIVVPTDTVYGVAALPSVLHATERLFSLKQRGREQPLAVLVADTAQGLSLIDAPTPEVRAALERHWPGALTLVVRRSRAAADLELGGDPTTIGIRSPAAAVVRAIAGRVGPLATTSANRHGEPTPTDASAAARSLAGRVALVIDGGPGGGDPSTVVDTTVTPWRVLRPGPVVLRR